MNKFWAVVRREYFKIVWTKLFIISTLLAPVAMILVSFLPVLFFSIEGSAVRLAVIEDEGKIYRRLEEDLSAEKQSERRKRALDDSMKSLNTSQSDQMKQTAEQFGSSFVLEQIKPSGKTVDQIKNEMNQRIAQNTLDAYLIIPPDFAAPDAKFSYFARNASDFVAEEALRSALNDSVRLERMSKININEAQLKEINQRVNFLAIGVDKTGNIKEGTGAAMFYVAFGLAFVLYLMITIFGSSVIGAVVEEKETKIAEILFSSTKPFTLMMGKLVGVCLAAFTQVAIWVFSALALVTYVLAMINTTSEELSFPSISAAAVIYFFIFFIIGFLLYSTIYALIGSMVTNTQEGGQFVLITVFILMAGLYSVIPIARDPNSVFSTIISLVPFVSPISMPARIVIETPPLWQIIFSILLNIAVICGVTWVAARVYRVGMLMYGKRATIPEVLRWIRTN